MSRDRLVYVYAVAADQARVPAAGIDSQPVRWIGQAGLHAAVSDVLEADFNEHALNAGLTDMHWLGPRALAHQEVNQQLHETTDALIPLAFGTVFRDDGRVKSMLREQVTSLMERLKRVRRCSEWVVTVHRAGEPDTADLVSVRQLQGDIAASAPGRAHLLRKRLADVERDAKRELEQQAVVDVLAALRESVQELYVEPLPTESVERPLLRASALVRRDVETAFTQAIERMPTSWYQAVLTGPWPAYRFAGLQQEHAATTG